MLSPNKAGPGRHLTEAEVRQRSIAGKASAAARHRQGETTPPSRAAIALFRQGQQRPGSTGGRAVWDTRSTEPTIGSVNASFTMHFPQAYRSKQPDPAPKGRGLLAAALATRKGGEPRDLTVKNPATIAEAHRHPEMRELVTKAIGVVRDHQVGAIARGRARGLIPDSARPGVVNRAYKHAALLALHRAGLGDYDFKMDDAAKKDFEPLTDFMRFAHRRVFDQLNVRAKGKWVPFREEFGQLHVQRKHGKPTGLTRMRMRPNDRFVKIEILDDEPLEKAWDRAASDSDAPGEQKSADSGNRERQKARNQEQKMAENGHDTPSDPYQVAVLALRRAEAMLRGKSKKPVPAHPAGDFPHHALHAGLHVKHAADAVERHLGLRKIDMSFMLGDPVPYEGRSNLNANPATQLRRAMHPRIRRNRVRVRLNTQRHLRRALGGGVTHQERWQIGATSRIPLDPFGKMAKRYLDKPEGEDARTWPDGLTSHSRRLIIAAARQAADPTDAQAAAGNYRMGHARVAGFHVTIETPKGRLRRKIGKGGKRWSVRMPAHYGYLKRTEGADGDHLDVYLGPHAHQAHKHPVFLVDQCHADSGRFDEHKAMLGFRDSDHATRTYDAAFSDKRGPERRKAVHEVTMEDFRHWVGTGDMKRPYADKTPSKVDKMATLVDGEDLAKGLIGASLAFGARRLRGFGAGARSTGRVAGNVAGTAGLLGAHAARKVGGIAGAGARRLGQTRPGQAIGQRAGKIAAHPKVAPIVDEAKSIGRHGIIVPVSSAGRLAGRAIGGKRGANIGGKVGLLADYAPPAILAYQAGRGLLGHHDIEQRRAVRRLRSGTGVQQLIGRELGKRGLAEIMQAAISGEQQETKPPIGDMTLANRALRSTPTPKTKRGIYTSGLKHAIREHWKVIHGGAPSPHVIAQVQAARRAVAAQMVRQRIKAPEDNVA